MKKNKNFESFFAERLMFLGKSSLTNLYIIILATLIIGSIILSSVKGFIPILFSDNAIYAHLTWYFTQGQFDKAVHIWWQPLYPFLGSLFFLYFRDIPLALFYVSVTFGILLFTPVFLLAYEVSKNRIVSIVAGLLATFHLQLIKSFYTLLTENLYITLFMFCALFAVYTFSRKKIIYAFVYGLIVGITYIARSDILLSYQIFLGFGLLLLIFKQIPRAFYFKTILVSIIAFIIAISPYLYFNYQKFGFINLGAKFNAVKNMPAYFSPQNDLTTTYAQDVWSLENPNYDSAFFNKPFPYYKYRIELWESSLLRGQGYIKLFFEHENRVVIYISLAAFIVSVVFFLKYAKSGLYLNLLTVLGFSGSLPFQPGVDFRYSFWMYPLFSIFTAMLLLALNRLIAVIALKKEYKVILFICLNLVLIMFYYNIYKNNLIKPPGQATDTSSAIYRIVGEHIKNLKTNARVMTRRESITYYAKGEIIYIPSSIDMKELENYARLYKPDFIVADRDTFPPDTLLKTLNDLTQTPDWLVPVKVWTEGYPRTILYQVKL